MKSIVFVLIFAAVSYAQPAKRLLIEDRTITTPAGSQLHCHKVGDFTNCSTAGAVSYDVSAAATKRFTQTCPAVSITANREVADYVLKISQGSSVLYSKDGDVAYISPARTFKNMVKDVCRFAEK